MKYLIQFSQQHESFWLPELDTMLELNGVDPYTVYDHDKAWASVSKGHKVIHVFYTDLSKRFSRGLRVVRTLIVCLSRGSPQCSARDHGRARIPRSIRW